MYKYVYMYRKYSFNCYSIVSSVEMFSSNFSEGTKCIREDQICSKLNVLSVHVYILYILPHDSSYPPLV